jgi:hypothetical protein
MAIDKTKRSQAKSGYQDIRRSEARVSEDREIRENNTRIDLPIFLIA